METRKAPHHNELVFVRLQHVCSGSFVVSIYLFIYLCFSIRGRVNQGRSQWQTQIKESRSTKIKSGLAHHFFALYLFSKSGLRFLSYYPTAPRYI